jgi:TP901 family phage tail tape measure protein
MSDISGNSEKTDIVVNAKVEGVESAIEKIRELGKAVKDLRTVLAGQKANLKLDIMAADSRAATKSVRELDREYAKLGRTIDRTSGKIRKVGLSGITSANKDDKANVKRITAWQEERSKAGQYVIARPQSREHLSNNMAKVSEAVKDAGRAGLVTKNVFHSLNDGVERFGARGMTSFEQLRTKMFVFNKGLSSVAFNMHEQAKKMQWTGRTMFTNVTLPITGFIMMAGREFLRMDKEMFQLKKVLEFNPKIDFSEMKTEIQALATTMGLGQAATANLYKEIGALGVAASSISGWAKGITEIAGIGDIDLTVATEFFRTTNALFTQGNSTQRLEQTIELMQKMNAVADETSLQLKDLADAFPEVAPVMQQMGLEAEQVAASLAGMYRRGIPASEAAHALKFGMQRLVNPTKDAEEYLRRLGFTANEFTQMKGAAFGESALEKLAVSLKNLPIEEQQRVMGEIFGARQAARMTSWSSDVTEGITQVTNAMKDGVVTAEDLAEITSDYARALISSDAESLEKAGVVLKGISTPLERFNQSVQLYLESPHLQWESLKTQFQVIFEKIGAIVIPTLIEWGKKFSEFLDKILSAPPALLKFLSIIGAMAAAFGPAIITLSAFKSTLASVLGLAAKLSTKGYFKDIMPEKVGKLLDADPLREDIFQVDGKFIQKKGGRRGKLKLPKGAETVTEAVSAVDTQAVAAQRFALKSVDEGLEEISQQVSKARADMLSFHAEGAQGAAAHAAAIEVLDKKLEELDAARGAALSNPAATDIKVGNLAGLSDELDDLVADQKDKIDKANFKDLGRKRDGKRLFGNADDAARTGQLQGMTWGRAFGKNADDEMKGFWNKTKKTTSFFFRPVKTMKKGFATGKTDIAASAREGFAVARSGLAGVGDGTSQASKGLSKLAGRAGKLAGPLSKLGAILPGLKIGMMGIGIASLKLIAIFSVVMLVVIALGAVLYGVYTIVVKNWSKIRERIQPAIDALKVAFEGLKEAFSKIKDAFVNAFSGTLFKDNPLGGDKAASDSDLWQTAASIIEGAIGALTWVVNFLATVVEALAPVISHIGKIIGSAVGFWIKLFTGDLVGALKYLVKYFVLMLTPVGWVMEKMVEIVIWGLEKIIWAVKQVGKGIGWVLDLIPGINGARKGAEDFFRGWESWMAGVRKQDWVGGLNRAVDGWLESSKFTLTVTPEIEKPDPDDSEDDLNDSGEKGGEAWNDGFKDEAGKDVGKSIADNILADFLGVLKPRLRKQMDELKQTLEDAFEANKNDRLSQFDDQIKKIEDAKKAEEELLKTQEYIERKRELMQKRALDMQNYQRNRALAIYEGRISDVRQLDLNATVSTKDYSKNLLEIENDRQKYLTDKARDGAIDRINLEKKAEEERLQILEKAFKAKLDMIMEYEPRTVAEFEGMMSQLKGVMNELGIAWPASVKTAADYYLIALAEANKEIINNFGWGGEAAVMQWVNAFIDKTALEILKLKQAAQDLSDAATPPEIGGPGGVGEYGSSGGGRGSSNHPDVGPRGPAGPPSSGSGGSGAGWNVPSYGQFNAGLLLPPVAPIQSGGGFFDNLIGQFKENTLVKLANGAIQGVKRAFESGGTEIAPSTTNMVQHGVVIPANGALEISSPSKVFYKIGVNVVSSLAKGIREPVMWSLVRNAITSNLIQLVTYFSNSQSSMKKIGYNIVSAINSGIREPAMWTFVKNTISTSLGKVATEVSGINSQDSMKKIGRNVVSAVNSGIREPAMWGFVKNTIDEKIDSIALMFVRMSSAITSSLSPIGSQLALWFAIELTTARDNLDAQIVNLLIPFSTFSSKATQAMGSLGGQMSLHFARELTIAGNELSSGVQNLINRFSGFPAKATKAMGSLSWALIDYFRISIREINGVLPGLIESMANVFRGFDIKVVSKLGPLGISILRFIIDQLNFVKGQIPPNIDSVASEFSVFADRIIGSILSGASASGRDFENLGRRMFNTLINFVNSGILQPLRDFAIPRDTPFIGGQKPFSGLANIRPIPEFHTGGIVGKDGYTGKQTNSPGDILAVLQKGEGVLPKSAMSSIGPKAFEMLRRGMLGGAVSASMAGKVFAMSPMLNSIKANSANVSGRSESSGSGDVYISVDTFIGEEQWFKSMADKYDMKVSARRAKANGSQSRVISSYNANERNTYR